VGITGFLFNRVPIIFTNSLSLRINHAFSLSANLNEIIIYIQILVTKMSPGSWRRDGTTPVRNSHSCVVVILIQSKNCEFILPQSHSNITLSSHPVSQSVHISHLSQQEPASHDILHLHPVSSMYCTSDRPSDIHLITIQYIIHNMNLPRR
jgi:hypothetical protein